MGAGASIESRIAALEKRINARKAVYCVLLADGQRFSCDALEAGLTRIDAEAGACAPVVSITLIRGNESALGNYLRQLIAAE